MSSKSQVKQYQNNDKKRQLNIGQNITDSVARKRYLENIEKRNEMNTKAYAKRKGLNDFF